MKYSSQEENNTNDSQNSGDKELLVFPWVGVVANIPLTYENGKYVAGSGKNLKNEFRDKGFNPVRVNPIWSFRGHTGFAVVEFGKDWAALHCAMKFEKCFDVGGRGKQHYTEAKHRGSELFGWIARADDYNSENALGEFLRKYGDLTTVDEIEAEKNSKSNTLLWNLNNEIEERNMHLREIEMKYNKTSISLNNLIVEKDKMFQAYNEEIQKMQQNAKVQFHNIVKEHQQMKFELEQREEELLKREAHNDSERKKLEIEKEMNERAVLEQKKADENMLKLAEDHKRNKEELRKRTMELEKQINAKQGLELEIERMRGTLSVMKHMENDGDSNVKQKIGDTQKALQQKEEELEDVEALNQSLVVMERKTNDELQEARKELITFLKKANSSGSIGVKGMGELDSSPFLTAFKRKFPKLPKPEAEVKATELCTLWEDHLRDPNWHPFKIVAVEGGDDHKEIINEEDEKLKKLKAEWGSEVQLAVTTALKEMNEYNPSGRYIIWDLWNHEAERKATLCEGVSWLLESMSKKRMQN